MEKVSSKDKKNMNWRLRARQVPLEGLFPYNKFQGHERFENLLLSYDGVQCLDSWKLVCSTGYLMVYCLWKIEKRGRESQIYNAE